MDLITQLNDIDLVTGKNSKAQLHAACKNIILLLNTHVD
jgi:hypothetical protein